MFCGKLRYPVLDILHRLYGKTNYFYLQLCPKLRKGCCSVMITIPENYYGRKLYLLLPWKINIRITVLLQELLQQMVTWCMCHFLTERMLLLLPMISQEKEFGSGGLGHFIVDGVIAALQGYMIIW